MKGELNEFYDNIIKNVEGCSHTNVACDSIPCALASSAGLAMDSQVFH